MFKIKLGFMQTQNMREENLMEFVCEINTRDHLQGHQQNLIKKLNF